MKKLTLSLLTAILITAAGGTSAWWGNWGGYGYPYDPWDPRYWMEEFFGGGYYGGGPWGYGGPWGGYGYPYYGGYAPHYGGNWGYPYNTGWRHTPYVVAQPQTTAESSK